MFRTKDTDNEFRFGDNGPKYLCRGPRSDFGIVVLKPGQDFQAHKHERIEEAFYTVEGEVHLYCDGELNVLGVGDYMRCDPGEIHYVVNKGAVNWKAVFVKSPYDPTDGVSVDWKPEED